MIFVWKTLFLKREFKSQLKVQCSCGGNATIQKADGKKFDRHAFKCWSCGIFRKPIDYRIKGSYVDVIRYASKKAYNENKIINERHII